MTESKDRNPDTLRAGQYYRISAQGLGALVRAKRLERAPKLGHEIMLTRAQQSPCWVTWFAGKYEVRCYSHSIIREGARSSGGEG